MTSNFSRTGFVPSSKAATTGSNKSPSNGVGLLSWKWSCKKPDEPPAGAPSPAAVQFPPAAIEKPRGQQFPVWQVEWYLRAVLDAATSLRGAAATLKLLGNGPFARPQDGDSPTAACGRLWLLRVGL